MRCAAALVALLAATANVYGQTSPQASTDALTERVDAIRAMLTSAGGEAQVPRLIHLDSQDRVLVLLPVEEFEGGRTTVEFIALIGPEVAGGRSLEALRRVGETGARYFPPDLARLVRPDRVELRGRYWKPADPACCPTAPVSLIAVVRNGDLELRALGAP
jgi:hypothetical protein